MELKIFYLAEEKKTRESENRHRPREGEGERKKEEDGQRERTRKRRERESEVETQENDRGGEKSRGGGRRGKTIEKTAGGRIVWVGKEERKERAKIFWHFMSVITRKMV